MMDQFSREAGKKVQFYSGHIFRLLEGVEVEEKTPIILARLPLSSFFLLLVA